MEQRDAIRRIMISVNRIDGIYEKVSKQLGVKANMIWFLYALDDGSPHSQKQLCEEWMWPRTTLNTIIQECIDKGYVTLEPILGKRREMYIRQTEAGKAYARKALDEIYNAEGEALTKSLIQSQAILELEQFCNELKIAFEL